MSDKNIILDKIKREYISKYKYINKTVISNIIDAAYEKVCSNDYKDDLAKDFIFEFKNMLKIYIHNNKLNIVLNFFIMECQNIENVIDSLEYFDKLRQTLNFYRIRLTQNEYMDLLDNSVELYNMLYYILKYLDENNFDITTVTNNEIVNNLVSLYRGESDNNKLNDDTTLKNKYKSALWSINLKLLSHEEETELFEKINNGDKEATETIIKHNIGLIRLCIKDIKINSTNSSFDYDDLMQCGIVGLMNAIKKFDNKSGLKFSTYAIYWIKNSIYSYLQNCYSVVRLPTHVNINVSKVRRASKELEKKYGDNFNNQDIAALTSLPVNTVNNCIELSKKFTTLESINKTIDNKDDSEIVNFIKDETIDVEAEVINKFAKDEVQRLFEVAGLTDRERTIIELRYGLYGENQLKLETVGMLLNITRERARQIEVKSLNKLKSAVKLDKLTEGLIIKKDNIDISSKHIKKILQNKFKKYNINKINGVYKKLNNYEKELISKYGELKTIDKKTSKDIKYNIYINKIIPKIQSILDNKEYTYEYVISDEICIEALEYIKASTMFKEYNLSDALILVLTLNILNLNIDRVYVQEKFGISSIELKELLFNFRKKVIKLVENESINNIDNEVKNIIKKLAPGGHNR